MHFDDDLNEYLADLRLPELVSLACPACQAIATGLGKEHAADLLAIHREGTCQGASGVQAARSIPPR